MIRGKISWITKAFELAGQIPLPRPIVRWISNKIWEHHEKDGMPLRELTIHYWDGSGEAIVDCFQ